MSDYKRYVSTTEVDARRLDEDETVVTAGGPVAAEKGAYAVRQDDGTVTVASAEEFEDTYKATSAPKASPARDTK
jgi:hypothetical protein